MTPILHEILSDHRNPTRSHRQCHYYNTAWTTPKHTCDAILPHNVQPTSCMGGASTLPPTFHTHKADCHQGPQPGWRIEGMAKVTHSRRHVHFYNVDRVHAAPAQLEATTLHNPTPSPSWLGTPTWVFFEGNRKKIQPLHIIAYTHGWQDNHTLQSTKRYQPSMSLSVKQHYYYHPVVKGGGGGIWTSWCTHVQTLVQGCHFKIASGEAN